MTLVAIAHQDARVLPPGRENERVVEEAAQRGIEAIERACAKTGWPTQRIVVGGPRGTGLDWTRALVEDLDRVGPDVIVNLVEGVAGDARLAAAVAWIFELSGIPYTGAHPAALALALDKPTARRVLASHGIAVPRWRLADRGDETFPDLAPPFIVKPSREGASRGVALDSVVEDEASALRHVLRIARVFRQPALVEELAAGREFHAIVLGEGEACELLPLSEIDYGAFPSGRRGLLTFDARWKDDSAEAVGAACVAAKDIDEGLRADLAAAALSAYRVLGLRDVGRVEMRVHPDHGPVVIDANANPDFAPGSGVIRACSRIGLKQPDFVERLVEGALRRGRLRA